MIQQKAVTQYINILVAALNELHEAYPNVRIELHAKEYEPGGWQCWLEQSDHGVALAKESFYINPPDASQP